MFLKFCAAPLPPLLYAYAYSSFCSSSVVEKRSMMRSTRRRREEEDPLPFGPSPVKE
jgi:hypothetical protein